MMTIEQLKADTTANLKENILKFWQDEMIDPAGGFYGQMTRDHALVMDAPKGAVLNARILWTFSAAYKVLGDEQYLHTARYCYEYFVEHFIDKEYGGVYWSLHADGTPLDTKKQFYALGFAIYGLSEYYNATGSQEALDYAIAIFNTIEEHSYCEHAGGYIEATQRNWEPMSTMRLSEKDTDDPFSMNTHLHILEPYTNLYRMWKSDKLKAALTKVLNIFCERIYVPQNHHLGLFFNLDWERTEHGFSYGHDIEASWLMLEAAMVLGDDAMLKKVKPISYKIAMAAIEGVQPDGSMIYEWEHDKGYDMERHWWVQAEAVVGFLWLHEHHGYAKGHELAVKCWEYIKEYLVDAKQGEWWWSRMSDGTINATQDKAGFWKCPYHNSRMCFEVINM